MLHETTFPVMSRRPERQRYVSTSFREKEDGVRVSDLVMKYIEFVNIFWIYDAFKICSESDMVLEWFAWW